MTRPPAGVSSCVTHWSNAISPLPTARLPFSKPPAEEVETNSAHSGLSSIALILCAGVLPAPREATVLLLPLFLLFLWKVSRCVLTFCSGCRVVRSRTSRSLLGRQLFSTLPAAHDVIVRTSIPRQMDTFYLLSILQVVM